MKTNLRVLASLIVLSLAAAARADEGVLRSENGVVAPGVRAVQVENKLGRVTVVGAADGFGWEWNLRSSNGRDALHESFAQDCRIEVRETDGVLKLRVVRPDESREQRSALMRGFLRVVSLGAVSSGRGHVQSELTLKVPLTSGVEVRNSFGPVRVEKSRAAVTVHNQNGEVVLADLEGAVTARTAFARLKLQRSGAATLTNQNGEIEATHITGDLKATTSFARMKIGDVNGSAELKNQNGAIEAARVTGDVIADTSFATIHVRGIGGRAELRGQNSNVDVSEVTGALVATTSFGALRVAGANAGAELKNQNGSIVVERVTGDLSARTTFAEIRVGQIGGNATLTGQNTKIEAVRVTGRVQAKTSFGAVRLREIGGAADLESRNGEIVAAGMSGDVRARTSFARMQLEGSGRRFDARNQNGGIEIIARAADVEHIDASASFAPIDVRLPRETKPVIRAATSHGKVHSDFPMSPNGAGNDAKFEADSASLKVALKGQNSDIRVHRVAAR